MGIEAETRTTCQVARTSVWALVSLVTMASCAANIANINDTTSMDRNEGVLVATIKTNLSGRISLVDKQNLAPVFAASLDPGVNFIIIKLPVGKYHWANILLDQAYCTFAENEEFELVPNTINYVGDPEIVIDGGKCDLTFRDHTVETKLYLQEHYPKLIGSHEFSPRLPGSTAGRRPPDSVLEDGEPRPLPPNPHAVIAKLLTDTARFRDQLCACEDRACADRVSLAMDRWAREAGPDEKSPKLTAEEQAQLDETTRALNECKRIAAQRTHAAP